MSILLPTRPGVRTGKPRLLDFGLTITPPLGGPAQRVNRLGNRFAVDVEAPTSDSTGLGRILISRLMQGLTQGVILPFPQDFDPGAVGSGVEINGAGQQGSSLNLKGFPANYLVREGQFFSIIFGGRRYLHAAASDWGANDQGALIMPIVPMLRISPNDGAVAEFAQPMIEGFLSGNVEWQLQTAAYVDVKFTITEAE